MLRPPRVMCHVCHGDDIAVRRGVLAQHKEQIVTSGGLVVKGDRWCDGGGQRPELSGEVS